MSNGKQLCQLVTAMVLAADVVAIPLSQFYPFGEEAGDTLLNRTLDGSSPNITLPLQLLFFGQPFDTISVSSKCMQIQVNNNHYTQLRPLYDKEKVKNIYIYSLGRLGCHAMPTSRMLKTH